MSESYHTYQYPLPKSSSRSGPRNNNWRGGRVIASNGYILIRYPGHHLADSRGYVYEHRLIAEEMLGRPLQPGEEIHHRDENKQNNHPDNLLIAPSSLHHRMHHRKRDNHLRNPDDLNTQVTCACGCGIQFYKYDSEGRPRTYVSGHNAKKHPFVENHIVMCACGCGTQFYKYGIKGKVKTFALGHSMRGKDREANTSITCLCGCGTSFNKYDTNGRPRKYVSGHNQRSKKKE